jgi:hypothetical protein
VPLPGSVVLLVSRFGKETTFEFSVLIVAKITDTYGVDYMHTTLISYMYPAAKVTTKSAESQKEYQIRMRQIQKHKNLLIVNALSLYQPIWILEVANSYETDS